MCRSDGPTFQHEKLVPKVCNFRKFQFSRYEIQRFWSFLRIFSFAALRAALMVINFSENSKFSVPMNTIFKIFEKIFAPMASILRLSGQYFQFPRPIFYFLQFLRPLFFSWLWHKPVESQVECPLEPPSRTPMLLNPYPKLMQRSCHIIVLLCEEEAKIAENNNQSLGDGRSKSSQYFVLKYEPVCPEACALAVPWSCYWLYQGRHSKIFRNERGFK